MWLSVLSCCGPLLVVVGACFACSSGVPRGWCSSPRPVGACRPLWRGGWPLVPSGRGPLGRPPPPFFSGLTVGVGCVFLFPCRRSLLCPRPRGWWFAVSPAGGWCWPAWGGLSSGLVVAPWPLMFVFVGRGLSPGWAGWSPSFLAPGSVGGVLVPAWSGVCLPCRGVCSLLWVCGRRPCCPRLPWSVGLSYWGREGCPYGLFRHCPARSWVGSPPAPFFFGGVCLVLPLPSLRGWMHWSMNCVASWTADRGAACRRVVCGHGPCPGSVGWWFMYTRGPVVRPVGWALGSGFSGWAVAPAGSLARAGSGGVGGGWGASLGVGCSPRPCATCWCSAGLLFLWPVVVCAGGPL